MDALEQERANRALEKTGSDLHFVYIWFEGDDDVKFTLYGVPVPRQNDIYFLNGEKFRVVNVAWSHRTYQAGPKEGQLMTYGAEITLGQPL